MKKADEKQEREQAVKRKSAWLRMNERSGGRCDVLYHALTQLFGASTLTRTEYHVIALIRYGLSNGEIAESLGIAPASIDTYCWRIHKKLGLPKYTRLASMIDALKLSENNSDIVEIL